MSHKANPIRKVNILYQKCLDTLGREVDALATMSIGGKLPLGAARDLRDYTKLLREMKQALEAIQVENAAKADAAAKAMPDSELKAALKAE